MPNHYSHIVVAIQARVEGPNVSETLKEWATATLQRVAPPASDSVDAQFDAWGTKWGVYDIDKPFDIPGDCGAQCVCFASAWCPPRDDVRALMIADANAHGIRILSWVGLNPYDDSAHVLYTALKE